MTMVHTLLLAALVATPAPVAAPSPSATPLTPERIIGLIRSAFRAHRPPPPYVTYTLERVQKTEQGYPDYVESYTYHIWCRSTDRACLARKVFRGTYRGDPEFQRPAFNEDRDPGPPTADLFEPAPIKSRPVEFVPTPEPSQEPLRELGTVRAIGEFDYKVTSFEYVGDTVHLYVQPTRDPLRNRIREIWADAKTYELRKLSVTDRLFVSGGGGPTQIYGAVFVLSLAMLEGFPVVTDIHGVIGDNYAGDGKEVDFHFRDIAFPATLPEWYFDPRTYGKHMAEMPL
jgi:hypothetical protein